MSSSETAVVDYEPRFIDELVAMWRTSFEDGVGIIDPNPIDGQKQYFLDEVLPQNTVRVALLNNEIVGFIAASPESISCLYVRVGCFRRGLGTQLLDWAKEQSAGSLWLYTFVQNERACAFYERSGFTAVEYGFEEQWQLDDVKYEGHDR